MSTKSVGAVEKQEIGKFNKLHNMNKCGINFSEMTGIFDEFICYFYFLFFLILFLFNAFTIFEHRYTTFASDLEYIISVKTCTNVKLNLM